MNWDSWIALIALLLALTGLVMQWRRGLSRLRIEVGQAIPVYGYGTGDMMLKIVAKNRRQNTTQLRSVTVRFPNGLSFINLDPVAEKPLPCTLGSFESVVFMWPYRELAQALKEQGFCGRTKIVALAEDGSGKTHRGSHKIDVNDWAPKE